MIKEFYRNRKVLITGHTGFKGTWMCEVLLSLGADVYGYALKPPTEPSLFEISKMADRIRSFEGDVRDLEHLKSVFEEVQPEIVIHMAAQPLVRESYSNPVYTYDVNVMGTVNVLECVRLTASVKSFVNVTTDKVYRNFEWERGYKEDDILNGFDPYSNSKSCSELVTGSYKNSFFGGETGIMKDGRKVAISTCRAGNVLGGGDFAADRIIPDCIRAVQKGEQIIVRNPDSTRPYQHVLEPVVAYLTLAAEQYNDISKADSYNIGPDEGDCVTTGMLVDLFCSKWNEIAKANGLAEASWVNKSDGGPHEAGFLKLDSSKIKAELNIFNRWHIDTEIDKVVEWTVAYLKGKDVREIMKEQIIQYLEHDMSIDHPAPPVTEKQ